MSKILRYGVFAQAIVCAWIVISEACVGYSCSDAVEATFHAVEMIRNGSLIPRAWMATNFAHLQVLPTLLGLLVCPSYASANVVAMLLMLVLTLWALRFCARRGLGDCAGALFALVYLMPVTVNVPQFFAPAYYAQFAMAICVVVGLSLPIAEECSEVSISVRRAAAGFLFANFVMVALMGMRMVAVVTLPLAVALVVSTIPPTRERTLSLKSWFANVLSILGLVLLFSIVGNLIYTHVTSPVFRVAKTIELSSSLMTPVHTFRELSSNFMFIARAFLLNLGFSQDLLTVSFSSGARWVRFVISLTFVVGLPCAALFRWNRLSCRDRFLLAMSVSSLVISAVILCLGHLVPGDEQGMCSRYLMLPSILLMMLGARMAGSWKEIVCAKGYTRGALSILVCLIVLTSIERPLNIWRLPSERCRRVVHQLRDAGLSYGYATYENALLPTYYGNGSVWIPHIKIEQNQIRYPGYCLSRDWYDPSRHTESTFLMLTEDELQTFAPQGIEMSVLGTPVRRLTIENYKVFVYDYNIATNAFKGRCQANGQ